MYSLLYIITTNVFRIFFSSFNSYVIQTYTHNRRHTQTICESISYSFLVLFSCLFLLVYRDPFLFRLLHLCDSFCIELTVLRYYWHFENVLECDVICQMGINSWVNRSVVFICINERLIYMCALSHTHSLTSTC